MLLGILGEIVFPCLFQLLETTCICWLMVPSSLFVANSTPSLNLSLSQTSVSVVSVTTAPSLTLMILSSLIRIFVITLCPPDCDG